MAGQACDLSHAGILPQDDLILTVAVRAHDFIAVLRPLQVANLRAGIDLLNHRSDSRVPETNLPICSAAARRQQSPLMGRPSNSFHGAAVLTELVQRFGVHLVPDKKLVIVAPTCQLTVVAVPFEAADFLLVASKLLEKLLRRTHVSMQDQSVTGA